jgi:Flp pilus assembly protein TadG
MVRTLVKQAGRPGGALTHGLCDRARGGQAVVEFALVLPVFLLLVFGALEFGRVFYRLHIMTNAAREGARVGSLPSSTESDVSAAVSEHLQSVGLNPAQFSAAVTVKDANGVPRSGGLASALQGDRVSVQVTHGFTVLVGTLIPGFSGTVQVHSGCVFRHE